MLLPAQHGIVASLALTPSIYTQTKLSNLPSFVRPSPNEYQTISTTKNKVKVEKLPLILLDDIREETLFSPLYSTKRTHYSYSLTSNTSKRKTLRQDKLRNKPWTFIKHTPSVTMSLVTVVLMSLVAKLVVYPAYFASLAYSKLR